MKFCKPEIIVMMWFCLLIIQFFNACYYNSQSDERISKPIIPQEIQAAPLAQSDIINLENLVPLTKRMVEIYEIGLADLKDVRVFLGEQLIIGEVISEHSKSADSTRGILNLSTHSYNNDIIFKKYLEGKIVYAKNESEYWWLFTELNIRVLFEDPTSPFAEYYLTFSPDLLNGRFEVEVNGITENKVIYGKKEYRCISGCFNNILYFNIEEVKSQLKNPARVVKGRSRSPLK